MVHKTPDSALRKLKTQNEKFTTIFRHGSLEVEIYQPGKIDLQSPHSRDEVYVIISGLGVFLNKAERTVFAPGDFIFFKAGDEHRFSNFTDDFCTWVFFYGPEGGEV
ncbi:MAG: cupin domain-containing protein [Saprospiraceae bacterium]|nr:cupin domain-containing protein [Saprospiraceae bacterium]